VELIESCELLMRCGDQLDGILARRMQVMGSRDTTVAECGRKLRNWMIEEQLRSDGEASRRVMVARASPHRPVIETALLAGEISLEHAARIVSLLTGSPVELRDVIEKELVEAARWCDPRKLGAFRRELKGRLGNTESTEDREARQYASRWLRLTPTFDGMRRIDGMLDPTAAATVEAGLHGLSQKAGADDPRSVGQRRADALTMMAGFSLSHGDTSESGGEPANVVVIAPLDTLRGELVEAGVDGTINGEPVSAALIRRLACDAGIIPAILGSHSEVLDLGRKTPTWNTAQRRALKIESGGRCGFERCGVPVQHCQAHHINWWSHLGTTATRNGVYLCHFHHWLVHHTTWRIAKDPGGKITVWRE
jgi:hypothetical protein